MAKKVQQAIRIGTLVGGGEGTANYIRQILPHGFESFSITFWQILGKANLPKIAKEVKRVIGRRAVISSLGIYGNPLETTDTDRQTLKGWESLIDPVPQLRRWVKKVFHVHGKCCTVKWDIIRQYGIGGPHQFAFHRTPGFGDANWTDIISELRAGGFVGSIDIEGWHDPIYRDELEMTGQVHGLNYLKRCRGGDFVPNPK